MSGRSITFPSTFREAVVRMLDDERGQPVERLWLYLTEAEFQQLREALLTRDAHDRDWHAHVEEGPRGPRELTIAVYDPAGVTGDNQFDKFLQDGTWDPL